VIRFYELGIFWFCTIADYELWGTCGSEREREREREREIAGGACGGGVVVMMMTMDAQLGRCCLHSFLSYLRIFAKLVWVKSPPKYLFLSKQRKN